MPESGGRIVDRVHVYPVRVYYDDTDAGGMVYYANYLRIAERARTELMRCLGHRHTDLLRDNRLMIAVRRVEVDYLRPARLDDWLEVRSRIIEVMGASMRMEQTIGRDKDTLARLNLRLVCITAGGRPARFPDNVRRTLLPLAFSGPAGTAVREEQRA